jgi:hypothetical protein
VSTRLIYEDLSRQDITDITFNLNTKIEVPGLGQTEVPIAVRKGNSLRMVIALSEPLCSNMLCQRELEVLQECTTIPVHTVSEIAVRGNLPRACKQIIDSLL